MENYFPDIDWDLIIYHLVNLLVAFVLAIPIALNREMHERSAGLRTFPIVAVAACGFMLIAIDSFSDQLAQSRVFQGVTTGIGFIGGGAILQSAQRVKGTATAASIWATGAIGIAVAMQRFEIAIAISALVVITLLLKNMKPKLPSSPE